MVDLRQWSEWKRIKETQVGRIGRKPEAELGRMRKREE